MNIFLIISAVVFVVGCIMDFRSSTKFDGVRVKEGNPLLRTEDGKFDSLRYVALMGGVGAGTVIAGVLLDQSLLVSILLLAGGVLRIFVARHNKRLTDEAGLTT